MNRVYILISESIGKLYVGNTSLKILDRLEQHNSKIHRSAYTRRGVPWEVYLVIDCKNRLQARKIEEHIKRMKSKVYIEKLKKYPEMITKLKERYS